jgi:cell wall-associated NlpC family hydrolase
MRRALLIAALLLVLTIAPSALAARTSWAQNEIETVVAVGLMAPSPAEFRPNDALTTAELAELTAMLGGTVGVAADPTRPVQVKELDAVLVRLFKLGPVAKHVRSALVAAGLKPPAYAGTEVVARLLGLRLNHPEALDAIELGPRDVVTRAETAYSVARVLALRAAGNARDIAAPAAALQLPELSDWQRRVLTRAVRFVGYPYIWGGSSERRQAPFGKDVPGGFDCSGFVWRVYKLEPFADAPGLAETLQGRTTYAMSGEVAPAERIPYEAVQAADVLFFGDKGPKSKPSQVGHMGLSLGNGWMIHSSSRGVTILPLEGWYADRFAWARRPLAEAGLAES